MRLRLRPRLRLRLHLKCVNVRPALESIGGVELS